MKVFEQELENAASGKKRVLFAVGFEEIELLHALLTQALKVFPGLTDQPTEHRMKNMQRAMAVYLGRRKPTVPKSSDFPCPICNRKLRGEKAIILHLKDIHPDSPKGEE